MLHMRCMRIRSTHHIHSDVSANFASLSMFANMFDEDFKDIIHTILLIPICIRALAIQVNKWHKLSFMMFLLCL